MSDSSCDIAVVCGKTQSVQVTAGRNVLPTLRTDVENGALHIYNTGNLMWTGPIKIAISVPDLSSVDGNGSGSINLSHINNSNIAVNVAGSGDISVQGQTDALSAVISGSGTITATDLRAQNSNATISGSGNIDLNAQHSLNAIVSVSGDIHYTGQPSVVHTQVTGSGEIQSS